MKTKLFLISNNYSVNVKGSLLMLKSKFTDDYYVVDSSWFSLTLNCLHNNTEQLDESISGPFYFLTEKTKIFKSKEKILQEIFKSQVLYIENYFQ